MMKEERGMHFDPEILSFLSRRPPTANQRIVDDDTLLLRTLGSNLQGAGHGVDSAPDRKTALSMCAGSRPDLVSCDVYKPETDGIEFLIRVREAVDQALTGHESEGTE